MDHTIKTRRQLSFEAAAATADVAGARADMDMVSKLEDLLGSPYLSTSHAHAVYVETVQHVIDQLREHHAELLDDYACRTGSSRRVFTIERLFTIDRATAAGLGHSSWLVRDPAGAIVSSFTRKSSASAAAEALNTEQAEMDAR